MTEASIRRIAEHYCSKKCNLCPRLILRRIRDYRVDLAWLGRGRWYTWMVVWKPVRTIWGVILDLQGNKWYFERGLEIGEFGELRNYLCDYLLEGGRDCPFLFQQNIWGRSWRIFALFFGRDQQQVLFEDWSLNRWQRCVSIICPIFCLRASRWI